MGTILSLKQKFDDLNTDKICEEVMTANLQDLNDINLEQMYDGKTNEGKDITPSYLDDPYWYENGEKRGGFGAALAYSAWKDRITPNPRRSQDTPNLFINGFYYRSRLLSIADGKINFNSNWSEGNSIDDKYQNINGLGGIYKIDFVNTFLRPVFGAQMQSQIGIKFR